MALSDAGTAAGMFVGEPAPTITREAFMQSLARMQREPAFAELPRWIERRTFDMWRAASSPEHREQCHLFGRAAPLVLTMIANELTAYAAEGSKHGNNDEAAAAGQAGGTGTRRGRKPKADAARDAGGTNAAQLGIPGADAAAG